MNQTPAPSPWIAFEHHRRLAAGRPGEVIAALQAWLSTDPNAMPVVLDAITSERIELDWRQSPETLLAALPQPAAAGSDASDPEAPRGPGRPRLGVTAREVTLLPRHWEWLAGQPGGASVALRKLVQTAMRDAEGTPRRAVESAYRFMSIVGGDLPDYEEVSRALFAGDMGRLRSLVAPWPADVREHLIQLASPD